MNSFMLDLITPAREAVEVPGLNRAPIHIVNVSRRDVLRGAAAGGALVLGTTLSACGEQAGAPEEVAQAAGEAVSGAMERLNLFVSLDADGFVQIVSHRAEMGQQGKTGMARVIADELEADWGRVRVLNGEGNIAYGDQNTDGSTTIRRDFQRLRRIGASVRSMLERAAAETWGAPIEECRAENHQVIHEPSGRSLGYGELAAAASALEPPAFEGDGVESETYALKSPSEWRYIGQAASSVDLDDIVQGKAKYGQDMAMEGMKFAVIARPPVFLGGVASFDAEAAQAVPGVEQVIEVPLTQPKTGFGPKGGIAVIASSTWAAMQGRDALNVEWEDGDNANLNTAAYRARLEAAVREPQPLARDKGDVDAAFADAAQTVEAEYHVPFLSHAQMEPPAALATYADGKVEVWTSTQNPQQARLDVAANLELDYEDVRLNNALLGGGFGRKSKPDFASEAALLSRAIGAPVKVVWTREDDIHHGYLHAISMQKLEAALDAEGNVTGWRHRVATPPIAGTFAPQSTDSTGELNLGALDVPFDVPNLRLENAEIQSMARIGWLRSVNNIQHAFAVHSFVAEIAHSLGRDPKDYLLELIGPDRVLNLEEEGMIANFANYGQSYDEYPIDTARLKNVINLVSDDIGWDSNLPEGRGMGICGHRSFLTYVATAVEVEVAEDGSISIPNISMAVDCGIAVNPESVRAQMEGASVFGAAGALLGRITHTGGRVDQSNYHDYFVSRMRHAPANVRVQVVESDAPPGGVGEPGTPPLAPALANAIFAATGQRLREIPFGDRLS